MAKKIAYNPYQLYIDFDVLEQEVIDDDVFVYGDIHNIREMLPFLRHHQQEDVCFAEKRFEHGKGVMFTNGTGTGKTFLGLGIAYRFHRRGLVNILIIVPSEAKCLDWIEEAEHFGLEIHMLSGIKDAGKEGLNITTYANFYQNDAITSREWDLVEYDESHYLNQNQNGDETQSYYKHKVVANLPSSATSKAMDMLGGIPEENVSIFLEKSKELAQELIKKTKVLFLSATPFAYHKSIKYGDGCLFDIEENSKMQGYSAYNDAVGFDKFLVENFGYRMRYNKITIPEAGVDVNLMERAFFEGLKEKGVISTRILEVDRDYSRDFITLESGIGEQIEEGINVFYSQEFKDKYKTLSQFVHKKYNYNYISQLLEVIKANVSIPRIKEHLKLGRKVVIFHTYNHSTPEHPFKFDPWKMLGEEDRWRYLDKLNEDIREYEIEYPQYAEMDISSLVNTREVIKKAFGRFCVEFNGTVPKKKRYENLYLFNDDFSGVNVFLVQDKAGREGISAHDRTGMCQRVSIFFGLPTAPTQAIQLEGRTYRDGVLSDAIYEYMTIQTNFERTAFADKIAQRSKTAENLAMGNLARDLETAFKEGYLNSIEDAPYKGQGKGGKHSDRHIQTISDFEKAITFYYSQQKRTSKNKSREGIDYFSTPEPLGYKMVEWMNPSENERWLEPSAGHGAIARWFKGFTINKFIEPSIKLSSLLGINASGEVYVHDFESYAYINKFETIIMNPPFGVGGKTAAEHIEKAAIHMDVLRGKIMAIVPNGPSMEKRLEKLYQTERFQNIVLTKELILPSCTFERTGTDVSCKIIVLEKARNINFNGTKRLDLSYCKDIKEFFTEIEYLNF